MKTFSNGILVFAAKDVGLECLKYLVRHRAPLARVIVATKRDREIWHFLKSHSIRREIYTKETQSRLSMEGKNYDWILNLWSPHILRKSVLNLARHRLNIHPSFLPICRGNHTATWTIVKGLPAGVSLVEMGEKVDAGPVYAQKKIFTSPPIRGAELQTRLKKECVRVFKQYWPRIHSGKLLPRPQKGLSNSHSGIQTAKDRVKRASEVLSLEAFLRWALAHDFHPATTAEVRWRGRRWAVTVRLEEKS